MSIAYYCIFFKMLGTLENLADIDEGEPESVQKPKKAVKAKKSARSPTVSARTTARTTARTAKTSSMDSQKE